MTNITTLTTQNGEGSLATYWSSRREEALGTVITSAPRSACATGSATSRPRLSISRTTAGSAIARSFSMSNSAKEPFYYNFRSEDHVLFVKTDNPNVVFVKRRFAKIHL